MSLYPVYLRGKMYVGPVYVPCPYNVFVYFLEGPVHKNSKLEIMTYEGKSNFYKHSQKE